MLTRALASLRRSVDGAGVLAVGGVLTLLTWSVTPLWVVSAVAFPPLVLLAPLALAPAFVTRGYFVRVLADAAETGNARGAPPFVAWNELYRNGVKSAALTGILLAPLALLFGVVAVAGVALGTELGGPATIAESAERALGTGGPAVVAGLGVGTLAVVSAVYLVAFAYVRPAALATFAGSGRLRTGLHPKRVGRVAGSGAYATAWTVAAVALLIGYAIAAPFVPVLIGVGIVFVTRVVVYALYGRGAGPVLPSGDETAALETEPVRPSVSERRSAEAPPTVQTGRTVPFGGDIGGLVSAGESGPDDDVVCEAGSEELAGFEWGTDADDEIDGDSGDTDGLRFDWASPGGEREDKS